MSHIVSIETEVRDPVAIRSACDRLRLPEPVFGQTKLFSSSATGWAVQLPEWRYPIVCDVNTAKIAFDNYGGRWGDQNQLDRFLQGYAVEKAKIEARKKGHTVTASTLWEQKAQMLKKGGTLQLYRGEDDFSRLGGLAALKAFTKRALLQPNRDNPLKQPRGVMLLSPPGCGKSQFCKALGSEVGRPVLLFDVGSLIGSLVGQSEERTRHALHTVDAMAPCVVMVDEVEKAFAGVNGSGDSGVAARMFGTFLGWLNDHDSDVFVVCTANDGSKLPPEFSRSERFVFFFVDLPSREEKDAIWDIYLNLFQIEPNQRQPKDDNFTGAEIRACCRLAALLDLPLVQAAQNVVPVAVTAAEAVDRLRNWASGRCLDASRPGIYQYNGAGGKSRRQVTRDRARSRRLSPKGPGGPSLRVSKP